MIAYPRLAYPVFGLTALLFAVAHLRADEPTTYIVGYDQAAPFHYHDANGNVVGTDADILREIAETLGVRLKFRELPWARTLLWIESGDVHIAIGAAFKPERAAWAHYSTPYKHVEHHLCTQQDQHTTTSVRDFLAQGHRLAVVNAWAYPPQIRHVINLPAHREQILLAEEFEQLPQLLQLERVDGIIANDENLDHEIAEQQLELRYAVRATYQEPLHFLFSKASVPPDFVAAFNNRFYQFVHEGGRERVLAEYAIDTSLSEDTSDDANAP